MPIRILNSAINLNIAKDEEYIITSRCKFGIGFRVEKKVRPRTRTSMLSSKPPDIGSKKKRAEAIHATRKLRPPPPQPGRGQGTHFIRPMSSAQDLESLFNLRVVRVKTQSAGKFSKALRNAKESNKEGREVKESNKEAKESKKGASKELDNSGKQDAPARTEEGDKKKGDPEDEDKPLDEEGGDVKAPLKVARRKRAGDVGYASLMERVKQGGQRVLQVQTGTSLSQVMGKPLSALELGRWAVDTAENTSQPVRGPEPAAANSDDESDHPDQVGKLMMEETRPTETLTSKLDALERKCRERPVLSPTAPNYSALSTSSSAAREQHGARYSKYVQSSHTACPTQLKPSSKVPVLRLDPAAIRRGNRDDMYGETKPREACLRGSLSARRALQGEEPVVVSGKAIGSLSARLNDIAEEKALLSTNLETKLGNAEFEWHALMQERFAALNKRVAPKEEASKAASEAQQAVIMMEKLAHQAMEEKRAANNKKNRWIRIISSSQDSTQYPGEAKLLSALDKVASAGYSIDSDLFWALLKLSYTDSEHRKKACQRTVLRCLRHVGQKPDQYLAFFKKNEMAIPGGLHVALRKAQRKHEAIMRKQKQADRSKSRATRKLRKLRAMGDGDDGASVKTEGTSASALSTKTTKTTKTSFTARTGKSRLSTLSDYSIGEDDDLSLDFQLDDDED